MESYGKAVLSGRVRKGRTVSEGARRPDDSGNLLGGVNPDAPAFQRPLPFAFQGHSMEGRGGVQVRFAALKSRALDTTPTFQQIVLRTKREGVANRESVAKKNS